MKGVNEMAERRMFTKKITESDAFLDMPSSTQMLYFHLSMNADDDGFVNNPKKIQRMCGAADDDFKLLLIKRFLLSFESGVIVIKHWKMHNYIQADRYKPTDYIEEKEMLGIKPNKAYTFDKAQCIQSVSVGKDRLVEEREGEDRVGGEPLPSSKKNSSKKTFEELLAEYNISDYLLEAVEDWIEYKKERAFTYKDRGMKSLLKTISEKSSQYGDTAVVNIINESISCGYQGIVWDKLGRMSKGGGSAPKGDGYWDGV